MLIYEKKVDGVRKLFGTMNTAPSEEDSELTIVPEFNFDGKYYYKAPGGIKDANGNDVIVSIGDNQIIPPAWTEEIVNRNKDEIKELVDDKNTESTDDDELIEVWTEDSLKKETKATILKMAQLLGYETVTEDMSKSEMIEAFLAAQENDPRKPSA